MAVPTNVSTNVKARNGALGCVLSERKATVKDKAQATAYGGTE